MMEILLPIVALIVFAVAVVMVLYAVAWFVMIALEYLDWCFEKLIK